MALVERSWFEKSGVPCKHPANRSGRVLKGIYNCIL